MRQTLLGVASFHRACLLAQDFTHEPACQTGERAPQGRFRHQPEQMVHPPFAWQLASFPSLPVCERRPRIAPCGTSPPYGHTPRKSRHGKPFLPSYQCIRNWSRSSGGTSRIIRECSSGDTVAKPAITMARLATGAPDSVNFRAMGYVKFPPHFRQGGSTE